MWAVDWESNETNQRVQMLLEAFSSLDLVLLNLGNKWTYEKGRQRLNHGPHICQPESRFRQQQYLEVTNIVHLSGERRRVSPKTNVVGWKAGAFNTELFIAALETSSINASSATVEVEAVMKRIIMACDVTKPHKGNRNH